MGAWNLWTGLPEWLPYTSSGQAGGGTCAAQSNSSTGKCFPGNVTFMPSPMPPWDKGHAGAMSGPSSVDLFPWCAVIEGVLARR